MSELQTVHWGVTGGVATLTLSRPDRRNALDPQMLTEILGLFEQLRRDPSVNVLVITGAGQAFCAGVDLSTPFFMENVESDSVYEGTRLLNWQHEMIQALYNLPQLTIAKINGNAVGGGGFGMAMACDMRFAVQQARFWAIPMSLGVIQDFGLSWFLQRACGMPRTMEILMGGQPVSADQAEAWGIINRAFATPTDLEQHVALISGTAAGGQADSVRMLKHIIRNGATSTLPQQLNTEAIANGLCFQSKEFKSAKALYVARLRRK